jgi:hypothetical protein
MPKGRIIKTRVEEEDFTLAEDYVEEIQEAKVTLVEEEQEVYDIKPPESNKMLVTTEPYHRKKQFNKLNKEDVIESTPTANQPGLLVRRLRKREGSNED